MKTVIIGGIGVLVLAAGAILMLPRLHQATGHAPDLEQRANAHEPHAVLELGYKVYYGDGVPLDLARAETLFRDAQAHGAPSNLCINWAWGIGFHEDPAFAFECFRLNQAHDWVAYMRAEGLGVRADRARAIADLWQALAAMPSQKQPPAAAATAARDEGLPRFVWSPDDHVDLSSLRQALETEKTGSYYSPGLQKPSPCWYLADTTADSLNCVGEEAAAERENGAIVERRLMGRLRPNDKPLVVRFHTTWVAFVTAQNAFERSLVPDGGTMATQMRAADGIRVWEDWRLFLEQMVAKDWSPAATPDDVANADRHLNRTYDDLMKKYESSAWPEELSEAKEELGNVQRAWMDYREAFANMLEALHAGERGQHAVGLSVRRQLTQLRADDLAQADEEARTARDPGKQ